MSSANEFAPITTTSIEAEPPLQKSLLPTQQPIKMSSGIKSSTVPPQQLQPASYTYSLSSSLAESPQNARDLTKKLNSPFRRSNFIYEQSRMELLKMSPNTGAPTRSGFKDSATIAGDNMPPTMHSNGVFPNRSPLLNDSAFRSAVQATAFVPFYDSPYKHSITPAMLSPESFINLGSMVAPGLPITRAHAASPAIQQRLLKMRDNSLGRKNQNVSTDPCDLASHKPLLAAKAACPHGFSSSSHTIKPTISEEVTVADGHLPGLHRDSQKVSIEDKSKQNRSSNDTAMPLQSLPVRTEVGPEYFIHYGKDSSNNRQTCPWPDTEIERTSTTGVSVNHQSRRSLEVFASPEYNTYASSTSVSPEGCFSWSPQQTFGTPASSKPYNTSKSNTPNSGIGEQSRTLSRENCGQNDIPTPPRKRKRSRGEGLRKGCKSSTAVPIDVKSASRSEGQRRKHEREASARYRQRKKAKKSAEPPEEVDKSVAISTNPSNTKPCGTHGSTNLVPPTGTEMALSSSQQSFSSILSGFTEVSTSSGAPDMSDQGTSGDGWPDLPELHHYERRKKINYGPLAPYGSAETIQTYPLSFQASLHRVPDFQRIEYLKASSHRVLFVYGSLMISDLFHDVFEHPIEWIFHNEVAKKCMCPAKVPGYSRFAVHGSDEPVMLKAEKSASSVYTNGMLIFGLNAHDFQILDRYLAHGFVREQVSAYVNLRSSSTNFEAEAYVWPKYEAVIKAKGGSSRQVRIDEGSEWTVARFWAQGKLCRIWREAVMERELVLKALREQAALRAMAMGMADAIQNA